MDVLKKNGGLTDEERATFQISTIAYRRKGKKVRKEGYETSRGYILQSSRRESHRQMRGLHCTTLGWFYLKQREDGVGQYC